MPNIFDEIEKEKNQLPELEDLTNTVIGKYPLNLYQKIALIILMIGGAMGFIIGNLMPACSELDVLTNVCNKTEFNLSIMLVIWAISFLITLFIYMIGHIIAILQSIDQKLEK